MTALPNPFITESDGGVESRHANSAVSQNHRKPLLASEGKLRPGPMTAGGLSLVESNPLEVSRKTKGKAGVASSPSDHNRRFILDVEAFCLAIEPAPLFLQGARP